MKNREPKTEVVPLNHDNYIFNDETMNSLIELSDVLRNIRKRMASEGYTIENGKIVKILPTIKY